MEYLRKNLHNRRKHHTMFVHWFLPPISLDAALRVRGIAVREAMPAGIIDRPAGTEDHLFMVFHSPAHIASRAKPAEHPPGRMVIWPAGHAQYYGHPQSGFVHSWIHCSGRCVDRLIDRSPLAIGEPFELADPAEAEAGLAELYRELLHPHPDAIISANLLSTWLRRIERGVKEGAPRQAAPEALLHVRRTLERDFAEPHCLADLARRAHLSVPHLCSEFKRWFGVPVIEYLIQQRMEQAAFLLRDRNLRVGEVARRVGYDNEFYFSRLFRKRLGRSPRQFRRSILGELR
jgi:AraC-like DNA-binding protein